MVLFSGYRCALSKRVCDGYLPEQSPPSEKGRGAPDLKPLSRRALAVAIRQLNAVGPTARILAPSPYLQDDAACFDFFRFRLTAVSHHLRDPSQTLRGFWNCTILQAAHLEPAVWHAVAALGALNRNWEVVSGGRAPPLSVTTNNPVLVASEGLDADGHVAHDVVDDSVAKLEADFQSLRLTDQANDCYTKALGFARSIDDPTTLLVLSIALAAASNIAGRWAERNVHIQAGLKIMAQMSKSRPKTEVEVNAAESLAKLALQWVTFCEESAPFPFLEAVEAFSAQDPSLHAVDMLEENGGSFFHRATIQLICMSQRILSHAGAVELLQTQVDAQVEPSHVGAPRTGIEESVLRDTEQWERETAHLLSTSPLSSLGTTLELLSVKLFHTAVRLLLAAGVMSTSYSELCWDACLAHFERLTALAALILRAEAKANPLLPPVTSLDEPAINICLWLVAHRCRHPALRRRAVALLRGARRLEGALTSTSTAEAAARIVELEEGGAAVVARVLGGGGGSGEGDWADVEATLVRSIEAENLDPGSWLGRDAGWLAAKTCWPFPGELVVPPWRRVAQVDVAAELDPRAGMSKAKLDLTFADRDSEGMLRKEAVTIFF